MRFVRLAFVLLAALGLGGSLQAEYTNFEVSHVHPIALTPTGDRLLAINTPDALLEVFLVQPDGSLVAEASIPVGLEPVTVVARTDTEAWVVNNLSDTVSIVDLSAGITTETLEVGDEPTDVAFAGGKAFISVSSEDAVKVYDLSNLAAAPAVVALEGRDTRALAVSNDGSKVYAVVLKSGNQTTVLSLEHTFPRDSAVSLDPQRLQALGLRDVECDGNPPDYPPLPLGIERNPALDDPRDGVPKVGLIARWNAAASQWQDETGQDWTHCLPYTLVDNDLFIIDTGSLAVTEVGRLGTSLFDVSVQPVSGKVYVSNTEARNFVRFEHPLGVQGHMVENRLSVVDPANSNSVTLIDLNTHINRNSDPATNLSERLASISQPGMMAWKGGGSTAYLSAIGSRKIFRVEGSCAAGSCIFGADRSTPDAVEVGEGPTGVVLHEGSSVDELDDRLYVLSRISHSIAIVKTSPFELLEEIPLHDPSSEDTRLGRRFLYDGIDTSGHGDASCASCHLSGDMDGLAWDLGDPGGEMVPYSTPMDNVRFITQGFQGAPVECDPSQGFCAGHEGFDPQKGPMATQTLRAMLEPLHWRGDRPTMNDFNMAFVSLMGAADIGPVNGKPAGVTAVDMERFRQFTLNIMFPPNPFRNVDDTLPCGPRSTDPLCEVTSHGIQYPGNPTEGEDLFNNNPSDGGLPCISCHAHPFGAAGGSVGGVDPAEPTSPLAAALFHGDFDASPHSDLKVPHLRNMYEKFGPVLADPGDATLPPTITGFGYLHDGSMPDLIRFMSDNVFFLSADDGAQQVRDMVSFLFRFPTGIKPAVGHQVTVPSGSPPTGSTEEEALLATLVTLGDLSSPDRHCELVASTISDGRVRSYHLSGGLWVTDVAGEAAVPLSNLRQGAQSMITFTCTPLGSGARLGGNRDEDIVLNGEDCAPGDAGTWGEPAPIDDVSIEQLPVATQLTWSGQPTDSGPSLRHDVLGANLSDLQGSGLGATVCLEEGLEMTSYDDLRADPPMGEGYYYVIRAINPCGTSDTEPGRELLQTLECNP